MRLVRGTHREGARRARRRGRGPRQLRHQARHRDLRPADDGRRRLRGHDRRARVFGTASRGRRRGARSRSGGAQKPPPAAVRRDRAVDPGAPDIDGASASVRGMAVGRLRAVHPGDPLGGVAVPSGDPRQPPPRHHDDGHPGVAGHAGRVRVVGSRARVPGRGRGRRGDGRRLRRWRRGARVFRDRVGDRRPAAARALLRGTGQTAVEPRAPRAARARREDGATRER